jgi:TRAP-type C4-dicarboxylate transport system permease small subunit
VKDSVVLRIARWLALAGGVLLVVAVAVTVVSVIGRYALSQPVPGDYELVEMICAVGVFLFLPYTHAVGGNIGADFFTSGLPRRWQRRLDLVHDLVFSIVALLLTWRVGAGFAGKFSSGEVSILIGIPIWWAFGFACLSMALLASVCIWRVARTIRELRNR